MISLLSITVASSAAKSISAQWRKRSSLIYQLKHAKPNGNALVPRVAQLPAAVQTHKRQWVERVHIESTPKSEAEQRVLKELQQVSLGVGVSAAGLLFFPLQLLSILFILPTKVDVFKTAYRHLHQERRFSADVRSALFLAVALLGGQFFALNVGSWFIVLVKWLSIKSEDHSKQGIVELFDQQFRSVWLLANGEEVEVPMEKVQAGDRIVAYAGQMILMDGVIIDGSASIDQHILTGEAQPAEKMVGDHVLAATIVLSGRICIQVEKTGEETVAAEIGRILLETGDYKTDLVSRANAFNDRMALPVSLLSLLSLPFVGLSSALSILLGAPGYRMMIYGPLSMLSHLRLAAKQGILVKDGRSLELLEEIDTIVFDKTGTLTLDQPHVFVIHPCQGFSEYEILSLAATAEAKQNHPIARAILFAAMEQGIVPRMIESTAYEVGYGVQVNLAGKLIRVGSLRFMEMNNLVISLELQALQAEAHKSGQTLVLVAVDEQLAGAIVLQPTLRPAVQKMIDELRGRGLQLYIISGDHDAPTQCLSKQLGMDGYFAGVLPNEKANLVKQLQSAGRNVCFVGDGINDAIALKTANVSISLHGASTIAIDTAQIVLMNAELLQLPEIFRLVDDFSADMRIKFLLATVPTSLVLCGALFLGWGLLPCTLLLQLPVPFALYNTIQPLLEQKHQPKLTGIIRLAEEAIDQRAGTSLSQPTHLQVTVPDIE